MKRAAISPEPGVRRQSPRAIAAMIVAAALLAACLSEPNYQGGGRLDTLPGVGGDASSDGDAPAPVDGFVSPPDNFVAPMVDAGGG